MKPSSIKSPLTGLTEAKGGMYLIQIGNSLHAAIIRKIIINVNISDISLAIVQYTFASASRIALCILGGPYVPVMCPVKIAIA